MKRSSKSRRQIDPASLALFLVGAVCAGLSYWLVTSHGWNVLVATPSIVALATGATHLLKRQAPR